MDNARAKSVISLPIRVSIYLPPKRGIFNLLLMYVQATLISQALMASYSLPIWFSHFLLLPLVLLLIINKFASKKQNKQLLPPGPPKLPIIGNLHQLGELTHQSLWILAKKYGPVMLLQLGGVPTVVISSSETAKEAMKIHDLDCCSRPALLGTGRLTQNYKDVGFTPYGEYWREMRKICVLELFSTKRVQQFKPTREEEVFSMIDSIISQSSAAATTPRPPVNLSEMLFALTASITFKIAFGRSFKGSKLDNDKFQEIVHETEAVMGSFAASDFFPYVGWIVDRFTGLHGRLERTFHELDDFFQQVIDDHTDPERMMMMMMNQAHQQDIIDVMLKIERDNTASGSTWFTKTNIKGVLINIFLGGVDTGAITMVWALTELVRNPKTMKKAQDEVRRCVGKKGKVTERDIDQLQYLKMVIKETMRLHPAAPLLLPRETMNHFKIQGYGIYPKTRMQINVWAIGRDPDIWKDPEEFIPERFLDSSIDYKGQHFELLPFGAGRRVCPGMYMATTTMELALANLLYCFDWELPKGMKVEDISMAEGVGLTTYKKVPLKLVPIKYQWPTEEDCTG